MTHSLSRKTKIFQKEQQKLDPLEVAFSLIFGGLCIQQIEKSHHTHWICPHPFGKWCIISFCPREIFKLQKLFPWIFSQLGFANKMDFSHSKPENVKTNHHQKRLAIVFLNSEGFVWYQKLYTEYRQRPKDFHCWFSGRNRVHPVD